VQVWKHEGLWVMESRNRGNCDSYTLISCSYRVSNKKKANNLISLGKLYFKNNLFQNRFKVTTLFICFSCLASSSSCSSSSFSFFPLMNLKRESHVICYSVLKENTVHPEMCSLFTHLLPSCHLRCIRLSFLRK